MTERELTQTYAPNAALRLLYKRFFDHIQVDQAWVEAVRSLSARGTVIYVLRNLNFIDFFALDHLIKRYGLPPIRYVNDLGLWILNPMGKGWLNAIMPPRDVTPSDELEDAIEKGGTAALFLKRPPGMLDLVAGASGGRGLREGDDLVRRLFELQRDRERPILLVPQVFVWTKHPDTLGTHPFDFLFGPREWPHPARTAAQFLVNYRHVELKLGEPLDVKEFLSASNGASDEVLLRRITYAMLRRLERERRSVTGPAAKPPDRVRHEIVRSPRIQALIEDLAGDRPEERSKLSSRALELLRELQANPELTTIKVMEVAIERLFHRIYAGIEYNQEDVERLRKAARDGTLILLPSHKSHIDYLVLSYIFNAENLPLPLIAAGDNLNFFPLGSVFRRGGAFFIRRSFRGDRLYAAVVDAYIRRLIRDGFPIEVFLEGGRSRTGKLLPPKFGLLSMVVDAALAVPQRQVFFVPVSIGYERVVEASSYERELSGGEKTREDAAGLLKTSGVLRHRYGRINLQVGQLLTLDELCDELGVASSDAARPAKRRGVVTRLGNRVMDEINRVTAVTPGALTALALLSHEHRGISHQDLLERCRHLLEDVQKLGARVTPTTQTPTGQLRPEAIGEALQMFLDAELIEAYHLGPSEVPRLFDSLLRRRQPPGGASYYTVREGKRLLLDTSKNIIVHFFVERALVTIALLAAPGPPLALAIVKKRVQELSRLFKFEFRFRADAPFDEIFEETIKKMRDLGVLGVDGEALGYGAGRGGEPPHEWLEGYASILRNFLEGYRVASRTLVALLKGPLADKEFIRRALALGSRMYLAGEIERREAVSKPLVENALLAFADQGYLRADHGKLELAAEYRSAEAIRAVEAGLAVYLGHRHDAK
jgi:glycerol-3-phosphate O-acyltransferase